MDLRKLVPRRLQYLAASVTALMAILLVTPASSFSVPGPSPISGAPLHRDVAIYSSLGSGNHLTDSPSGTMTQAWMLQQLQQAGLQTGVDGYSFYGFQPHTVGLIVNGRPYRNIAAYFYSGQTGPGGSTAQLAYAGEGTPAEVSQADVAGKIAVIDVPYIAHAIDPTFAPAFSAIAAAGAVGLIAVTQGPQDYAVNQDVDSRVGPHNLPTIFIGKVSGQQVIAAAQAGGTATLTLDATEGESCTVNVYGVLPGVDPNRVVVVGTPTTGWDPAASERGAGVAALLGLARHYAQLPLNMRPLTMVFVGLSGHEIGFLGLPTFIAMHPDWFSDADAYVHLGASIAAYQQIENPDGSITKLTTGDPTRALYVSENPVLLPGVKAAFAAAQPLRSVPPGTSDPGEQAYAYHDGIPIVAESGSSLFFHTNGDQPDGVSTDLLAGQAQGFANAIDFITGLPAGELRAANSEAAALGAAQNPNPTPTGGTGGELPQYSPQPDPNCSGILTQPTG